MDWLLLFGFFGGGIGCMWCAAMAQGGRWRRDSGTYTTAAWVLGVVAVACGVAIALVIGNANEQRKNAAYDAAGRCDGHVEAIRAYKSRTTYLVICKGGVFGGRY
jgi:hypothetical protein